MGRKKDEDVWSHFSSKGSGVECNFCKQVYRAENATKMRKHLTQCFHCPENIKLKLDKKSVDTNLSESLSEALELASNTSESSLASASSTPQNSRPSTPNTSRASTPNYPRAMTPFLDRMTDKENVGFTTLFVCNLLLNLNVKFVMHHLNFTG